MIFEALLCDNVGPLEGLLREFQLFAVECGWGRFVVHNVTGLLSVCVGYGEDSFVQDTDLFQMTLGLFPRVPRFFAGPKSGNISELPLGRNGRLFRHRTARLR